VNCWRSSERRSARRTSLQRRAEGVMRWLVLLAVLSAVLLVSSASAQSGTASISGSFVHEDGSAVSPSEVDVLAVPASLPQPIGIEELIQLPSFQEDVNDDGTFLISGLSAGDYLIVPFAFQAILTPLPETVSFELPTGSFTKGALPVSVLDGEAVAGVAFVVAAEPPPLSSPGFPTAADGDEVLPPSAGSRSGADSAGYLGIGIALLAAALLGGGIAMLASRRRHST
jgi:hypothetical protein